MKAHILTACVAALAGAAAYRAIAPERVRTEYRDRVRVVTIKDTRRTRVTTRPDGTRIEERTESTTRADSDTRRVAVSSAPRAWTAGAMLLAVPTLRPLGADLYAGGFVSRQLLGPVSVGLTATVPVRQPLSVPTVGVTLGVSW